MTPPIEARLDGRELDLDGYLPYHRERIRRTLDLLDDLGAGDVLEVGSHPWAMTASIVARTDRRLVATVSAEEHLRWPDELEVRSRTRELAVDGTSARFTHYVANVERTRFGVAESPEVVLACEIVEHLVRAPHVLMLNANGWLPEGGRLVLTTPNGGRFRNPLPVRSPAAGFRCRIYERHSYLFTLPEIVDLVERCGFRVVRAEYWALPQSGTLAGLKTVLGSLPSGYLRAKFRRGIAVVARKSRSVDEMAGIPAVYDPRGDWEHVRR